MNIIIPMAGRGSRLRPHTLTVPKPLIPIAGKPIVHRLVEDIVDVCQSKVEKIGFVIGDFGAEVEAQLLQIAKDVGAEGHIFYQEEALGTAHAVHCAQDLMDGKIIVAFADTLFKANFELDDNKDGIIWVKQVENPSAFGVVKMNENNIISDFIEKPKEFVSDLAIIGIYYFKEGSRLRQENQRLIDDGIIKGGEYQLTDSLEALKQSGVAFVPGTVTEWLDCGNKNATVDSNSRYLGFIKDQQLVSDKAEIKDSVIIPPVFIGEGSKIDNSVVGPYVSIGRNTVVSNSVIKRSLVQEDSQLINANLNNSMIGNKSHFEERSKDISIGDYSVHKVN